MIIYNMVIFNMAMVPPPGWESFKKKGVGDNEVGRETKLTMEEWN